MRRLLPVVLLLSALFLACTSEHDGAELETAANTDPYWEQHCAGIESRYAFELEFESVIEDWATLRVADLDSGDSYQLRLYHVIDSSGHRVFSAGEDVYGFHLEPEEYDPDGLATDLFEAINPEEYEALCLSAQADSNAGPFIEQAMVLAIGDGPWPVSLTSICNAGNSDLRARAETAGCVLPPE